MAVTSASDGSLIADTELYWGSHAGVNVYSYHPYNEAWSMAAVQTFNVNTDQSTDGAYLGSDLLYGLGSGTNGSKTLAVSYMHKLSKVVVTVLTDGSQVDLDGATVSVCGVKPTVYIDLSDGTISEASGDAVRIKAGDLTAYANSVAAIVAPQTIGGGTAFIEVTTADGKTLIYTLPDNKTLMSNAEHVFKLKISDRDLQLVSNTIESWDSETTEGELLPGSGSGTVVEPVYVVSWANIQWHQDPATIAIGEGFEAGSKVLVDGLTNAKESATGEEIVCEIGYSLSDDPVNGSDWTWNACAFNADWGDEFYYQGKTAPVSEAGTYNYAFRYKVNANSGWVYAGTDGLWDGSTSVCGTFVVE